MKIKIGSIVQYIDPPRPEFDGVLAKVVDIDYEDECYRIRILPEFVAIEPKLARRNIYRHGWNRFKLCKLLSQDEHTLLLELKAKQNRTPVEEYILFGLEH
jgi:hypothetical protein